MNQRIGVQHLECGAQFLDFAGQRSRHHAPGFHAQHWPQPLASGKDAVPHRLVNGYRMLGFRRNQPVQRGIGQACPCSRVLAASSSEYNKAAAEAEKAETTDGVLKASTTKGQRYSKREGVAFLTWRSYALRFCDCHAPQDRTQNILHVIGWAHVAGASLQRGDPQFLIRHAIGAYDRQGGKSWCKLRTSVRREYSMSRITTSGLVLGDSLAEFIPGSR